MDTLLILHVVDELMHQLSIALNQADWFEAELIATRLSTTLALLNNPLDSQ